MNRHLPEHDLPERDGGDFLVGALHGAADAMPGGEAEEVHLQFGVVRDRIHRRRAAKASGIGVAAFAVVGGLAAGVAQLAMPDDAALPADPSPSVTHSRSAEPSESPSWPTTGWMPSDIYEDTGMFCGADASSIGRAADGYAVEFEGAPHRVGEGDAATTLVGLALRDLSKAGGGTLELDPAVVWIQDGAIVSLSRYFDPEPPGVPYDDAGLARTEVRLDTVDACDPPEGAQDAPSYEPVMYEHVLAAGEYQVVPVLWTDITVGAAEYVTGEPMTVHVGPDGTVVMEDTGADGPDGQGSRRP